MNVLSQRSGLLHVDPDFGAHETAIQYREFYEYYLNELKRCAVQIMRKIEFPMGAYAIISPTPLPFTIQKQLEELGIRMPTIKSKYQTTPYQSWSSFGTAKILRHLRQRIRLVQRRVLLHLSHPR
jgi:hypothetical protein